MSKDNILAVDPSTPVIEAVKKMCERNVGSVLITDESGKLVGIFTERDLLRLVAQGKSLNEPISKYMTTKLIVAKPDDAVPKVASIMIEKWIRHIPVVNEEGKPVGVLSIRDVLRYLVASSEFP